MMKVRELRERIVEFIFKHPVWSALIAVPFLPILVACAVLYLLGSLALFMVLLLLGEDI